MAVNGNIETKEKVGQKRDFTRYFRELKAEFNRITWPKKEDAKKALIAVVTFGAIFIVLIGVLDFLFNNIFKLIFK